MMMRIVLLAATMMAALSAQSASAQTYKFKTIKDGKGMNTSLHDINDTGVAVGGVFPPGGAVRNCIIVKGKKITTLSDPKGVNGTECYGISSSASIGGDYVDANSATHAYIYTNSTFTDIVPPKSTSSVAYGVNASGVVVGSYLDKTGNQYGFLFDGSTYTTIKIKGGSSVEAWGINDSGDYTAWAFLSDGFQHSYLYSGGTSKEIVFPNIQQVVAHHFNNNGQISASIVDKNDVYHLGVYDPTNDKYYQIDEPKGTLTIGDGINDSETVVGRYIDSQSNSYGFIGTGKL